MLICLPGAIHAAEDRRSRPYGARLCRQYRRRSYTALLLISGMADSALLPLMLGCGVDVPVPIILVGALGGIIGMFAGATLLTWISHRIECIGASILRGPCCDHGFLEATGIHNVVRP